jgi:hypothetical protein
MKKFSGNLKVLLIFAVCAGFLVPSLVSAENFYVPALDWTSDNIGKGETLITLGRNTKCDELVFIVKNGDPNGKNRMSSVKVSLLDQNGEVEKVIIGPNKFNQKEPGYTNAPISAEGLYNGWMNGPSFLVEVGGKPTGYIQITIQGKNKVVYAPPPGPTWLK